jgi:hypothetical protein
MLPPLPDYKRYEPRVEEKRDVVKDTVQGTKIWDYVLTPLAPGQQDLPSIRFAWFDPARGAYVEASSDPQTVLVQRGEADPGALAHAPGSAGSRREVVAFGRDIRFIKGVSDLQPKGRPFHRSLAFGALLTAPLALNAGLLLALRRRERMAGTAGLVRGLKAPRFARRRLRAARALMADGKSRAFSEEVGRALTGYLADKLNVPPSGLTHDRIETLLAARGVPEALRQEVRRVLEACDFARFAPVEPDGAAMRRDLDEAGRLIGRLEREAFGRAGAAA